MENDQEEVPTASLGMWILLIFMALISFWCQATVTEERFVPALNVIANTFRIPDDIAGATLMAAGASSPELFSSFVALFVTHSSLGLGTVFGSEVFNQLIICAGAVYSSRTGQLELNKAVVIREVFFYALGIGALYLALQDTEPKDDDPSGIDHIVINFWDALVVFGGYIFYVIVCANMDAIVDFVTGNQKIKTLSTFSNVSHNNSSSKNNADGADNYGSIEHGDLIFGDDLPFLIQEESGLIPEPAGNFETVEYERTRSGQESESGFVFAEDKMMTFGPASSSGSDNAGRGSRGDGANAALMHSSSNMATSSARNPSVLEKGIRNTLRKYSDGSSLRPFRFLVSNEKPSDDHDLLDVEENTYEERLSCFLWQRSFFYNKARLATNGWHLRWFSFMHNQVYSVPNRIDFDRHKLQYPPFTKVVIDSRRLVIKIIHPDPEGKEQNNNSSTDSEDKKQKKRRKKKRSRDFYLLAPSSQIFEKVVEKLGEIIEVRRQAALGLGGPESAALEAVESRESLNNQQHPENREDHDFESLIAFPAGGSNLTILLYFLLFPFRALIHFTVPDVRTVDEEGTPNSSLFTASLACFMCLVWLIVGSYAMVTSLESLAALLDIPDAVIGYTVSAAGTSLPNYVASAVAARNGFGNMAVSNALGSNTFNIMIGLGLPWMLYTSVGNGFQPYDELRNEGITEGVMILAAVLLLLVILLLQSGFVLHVWHGHLFLATYAAYLIYIIGGVYFW